MAGTYTEDLHRLFTASENAKSLFEEIAAAPVEERERMLRSLGALRKEAGLGYALLALYRQQVNSGFVLADPLSTRGKREKAFSDPATGITFRLQWNPDRELRKNHGLLIERNVIKAGADETKLVNRDENGKACYLCKANIDEQNPGEILLEVDLGGDKFYVGANFAYITNNHFTVMNAEHRPQQYRKEILRILNCFVDEADGRFRVIFNGLAGASILSHEHMQATTEEFPVEQIKIEDKDIIYRNNDMRVSHPFYYTPVWVIEGADSRAMETTADQIIQRWHTLNAKDHTENIIAVRSEGRYRTFILLRDRKKLAGNRAGKKGAMAAFETGGNIILSYEPAAGTDDLNEKQTFERAGLETIRQLLREIAPDEQKCTILAEQIRAAAVY
ncbi:MAG: DUF4922 domain-containing protein [Planctomycetota bacterium]|jgi:hypothetical protein